MHLFKNIFILFLLLGFLACTEETANNDDSNHQLAQQVNNIPQLLDRPEKIQNGKEWENVQNAFGTARKKLLKDSKDLEAHLQLAQIYVMEARVTGEHGHYYPAALKVLNELLEKKPEKDMFFMALTTKAGVQLSLHTFKEALETAEKAILLNPYNAQIYGVLVDAYVELGNYEKAVEMADKMVAIRPDLRSYSRVSYLREIHGQIDGAIDAMKMAVTAGFPGYEETAWTRLTLGNLYQTYNQLDKAEMQYKMILQEREDYPFAIAALAEIEMKKDNHEKAEKLLKEACAIIPEVGFYEQLAHLYQKTNRQAEAEELMKEVFEMLADDEKHGHNMNVEYAAIYRDFYQDYDKALAYLQKEFEKRPNNIDVNRALAMTYAKKGDNTKAAQHIKKASLTDSKHPELLALQSSIKHTNS